MTPQQWQALQPLLDEALDADEPGRAALLSRVRGQDAALAAELATLLDHHHEAEAGGFLHGAVDGAAALRPAVQPGQRLGPYRLLAPIGEGGMGSVWRARRDDGRFDAEVAVKLLGLSLGGAGRAERFRREGRILARLVHPHIARLLDAGVTEAGQPYLVIEHVVGRHIDEHCNALRLDLAARLRLLLELAEAMQHAHSQLVVHRDIKPSNVMVDGQGRVKLLDFGIAKLLATDGEGTTRDTPKDTTDAAAEPLTQQLGAVHTPGYAAPEQLLRGEISTAADVYAFGALAHLLLSGRHPTLRLGATPVQTMQATLEREPPRMSQGLRGNTPVATAAAAERGTTPAALVRALQGDLDTLVAKALRREPAERYASAAALAEDLRRHLALEPILARPPSAGYLLRRFVQRRPALVAGSAMAVLALALVGGQAWRQQRAAEDSRTQAQAVEGLLASVFHGLGPTVAASRRFSADELLDRAQAYLEGQTTFDDGTRRAVRLRIANLYRDVGAYAQALRGFEGEATIAAQAGDPAALAQARWNIAAVRLAQGDHAGTESTLALMRQAQAPNAGPAAEAYPGATAKRQLL